MCPKEGNNNKDNERASGQDLWGVDENTGYVQLRVRGDLNFLIERAEWDVVLSSLLSGNRMQGKVDMGQAPAWQWGMVNEFLDLLWYEQEKLLTGYALRLRKNFTLLVQLNWRNIHLKYLMLIKPQIVWDCNPLEFTQ